MTHRYAIADFGHTSTARDFKKKYDQRFKGEGWYILIIEATEYDPEAKVLLHVVASERPDRFDVRGWFVEGFDAAQEIIDAVAPGDPVREQAF